MWSLLVDVADLAPRLGDPNLRILDCRHKLVEPAWGANAYAAGHLPGAVHAHIDHDLSSPPGPTTGRHPLPSPEQFRAACSRWGIDDNTQVVVYDDAGGIWAARAWWLLHDYGHKAVALLDGGITAWTRAGHALTQDLPRVQPSRFEGTPGHNPTVDAAQLAAAIQRRDVTLLDARAPERYRGETEPVDPVAGHIPTARNLPAVSLLGPEGQLLPADRLAARFQAAAPDPAAPTVAYCGSGVTATHLVLAAQVAGRGGIALYPGSWSEWIRDPRRPVERGNPDLDATPKAK